MVHAPDFPEPHGSIRGAPAGKERFGNAFPRPHPHRAATGRSFMGGEVLTSPCGIRECPVMACILPVTFPSGVSLRTGH